MTSRSRVMRPIARRPRDAGSARSRIWRARLAIASAVFAAGSVATISLPESPVSADVCANVNAYPPSGTNLVVTPSTPTAGQTFTVAGTGFPPDRPRVEVKLSGAPVATTSTTSSGLLLGVSIKAPTAEGTYRLKIEDLGGADGSLAINCVLSLTVNPAPPPDSTTPTLESTTTSTLPEGVTTTTDPLATTTTVGVLEQPGDVVVDGDFTYEFLPQPNTLRVSVKGLAPGSSSSLDARAIQRIHRAIFEDDPFDPLTPFDVTAFINADDYELAPTTPELGEVPPPPAEGTLEENFVGAIVTGAGTFNNEELALQIDEILRRLAVGAVPFPRFFQDDPELMDAVNWFLFNVTIVGARPGSNVNVFWYSQPIELARAVADVNGHATFQVAVPDTLITKGETDTLRIVGLYPLGTAVADPAGQITVDTKLSDEILNIAEKGSFVSVLVSGVGPDGKPKQGSIDIPIADEGIPLWVVISISVLLLLILLLILLWILRRRRLAAEEDDDDWEDQSGEGEWSSWSPPGDGVPTDRNGRLGSNL